jgi:hypothetical protein
MSGGTVLGSIEAAWMLLLRQPDALERFDTSFEGFWKSFFAVVLSAPLYIYQSTVGRVALEETMREAERPLPAVDVPVGVELVAFLAAWFAFPIVMIGIVRLFQIGERYVPYIVVYNWGTLLLYLLMLAPTALYAVGIGGAPLYTVLSLVVLAVSAYFLVYAARIALLVPFGAAISLVVLDFLVTRLTATMILGPYVSAAAPAVGG